MKDKILRAYSQGPRMARHKKIGEWKPRRLLPTLLLLLCLSLDLMSSPLLAQTTSTIEGAVKDSQGAVLPDVEVKVSSPALAGERTVTTNAEGFYRITALPAGIYTLSVKRGGFVPRQFQNLEVTLNRTFTFDITLEVGRVQEGLTVTVDAPLLEVSAASTGSTITPQQIAQMPINGRNYLDLLQLVPGVSLNRQADAGTDAAAPILGERSGNAVFLIDGLPNRDEINGGAAAQFNQDSILEFQVITAGYKAEFGHGSGGIINVVSKSGTNEWHGGASYFHRNYKLDSSNVPNKKTPFLLRHDPSVQLGGPILKDRVFFFGSAERIRESRDLNFQFPPGTPDSLVRFEEPFNQPSRIYDTRLRAKLDEHVGRHHFTQQINLTNTHVTDFLPLSAALNLPSTRNNIDSRRLMLGFSDLAILGNQNNPFVVNVYGQYRGEPTLVKAAHAEAGLASTLDNLFSSLSTGQLFGDLGQVQFGPGHTPLDVKQKYVSLGASLSKQVRGHSFKFGWDYQRMVADGIEATNLFNQLFATVADFEKFGPITSGVYLLTQQGGATPQDNIIRLRNNYNGVFAQDDWKLLKNLTLNLGLRWDYDSEFPNQTDLSPRVGMAWSITPKTVLRASYGLFYDHFRLGLARDIPGFGGANVSRSRFLSYPRLFYGNPSQVSNLFAARGTGTPCLSNTLTGAEITAQNFKCPSNSSLPVYGIDHLNKVVASGHAPIPANAIVNIGNVQALSGLSAQEFADAASRAIGQQPGFYIWDMFGHLTTTRIASFASSIPITVDPDFRTPYTQSIHVGIQRELSRNLVIEANYYHRDIRNVLGVRATNLAFEARLPDRTLELVPGTGTKLIQSYGPWLEGRYDGVTVGLRKRVSKNFTLEANYTYADAVDNALNSSFISDLQTGLGLNFIAINGQTDTFVGRVPVVVEAGTGKTNADGPFEAANGNPVPKAGIFYNGADLDKGPSDLALKHTFLMHGLLDLPWKFNFTGIFRAQSGFPFSATAQDARDVNGDGLFNGFDYMKGRNRFTAPPFINMDMRIAKRFEIGDRVKIQAIFELFNLFNQDNPAAVQALPGQPTPFGKKLQVLPGREGQIGLRIEF